MISLLIKEHEDHLPKILEEIGTNIEQLKKDVEILKEWYSFQKHLPSNIENSVLASFIVGCKNNIEKAKLKLDQYYSERRRFAQVFSPYDPICEGLVTSYKTVYTLSLPKLTSDGSSVVLFKLRNPDPNLYSPTEPMKKLNMILELMLQKTTLTSKVYIVYDYENCTKAHLAKGIVFVKTHLDTLRFLPIRIQGIILINCPKFAEAAYNIIKNFLSEKYQNRMFIYFEESSVLSQHFPKDVLPKDYGGDSGYTLEDINDIWQNTLVNKRDWFIDGSLHNSDESKRPIESKYKPETNHGVEGSFKTLAID